MKNKWAVRQLPNDYQLKEKWDLSKDNKAKVFLSLASLGLFILFWLLFNCFVQFFRPDSQNFMTGFSLTLNDPGSLIISGLVFLLIIFGMVFLHEAIHGLFFWVYTKEKPRFGFKVVYAFAGAPDWYLFKRPYIVVGVAPLLIITIMGLLLLIIVPDSWILPLLLFITMNASGAAGDIYAVLWLLRKADNILVNDSGDSLKVYLD